MNPMETFHSHLNNSDYEKLDEDRKRPCLVIEGEALTQCIGDNTKADRKSGAYERRREKLLEIAKYVKSVICCRATPLQKSAIVSLMREQGKTTLAIGDGANDVAMIQKAHVGVGLVGKEGMQASLASDYSIAQFRFLQRLLLVHGRYNNKRIALVVLYLFYKNFLFALLQFWWSFFTPFSGQTLIDSVLGLAFNLFFTSLPIIIVGIFDEDLREEYLIKYPVLYRALQRGVNFNPKLFWSWAALAVIDSVFCFFIPLLVFSDSAFLPNGMTLSLWHLSITVYTAGVIVVTLKLVLDIRSWTKLHHIAVWGSLLFFWIFLIVYNQLLVYNWTYHVYNLFWELGLSIRFWLLLLLTVIVCLLPDFTWKYINRTYFPETHHILQDIQAEKKEQEKRGDVENVAA